MEYCKPNGISEKHIGGQELFTQTVALVLTHTHTEESQKNEAVKAQMVPLTSSHHYTS